MKTVTGWLNVYRSGFFHREGKPDAFNRHAGDLYPTQEAAIRDIEPLSHYVATVPVQWSEPEYPHVNGSHSQPVPLSKTRKRLPSTAELQLAFAARAMAQSGESK